MGGESSTLRSIESLNRTLTDIEHKLYLIEDSHIILNNNETNQIINSSVSIDNTILLFNTRVKCREAVYLIVGPILGVITHNSVRVLIETNVDADISIHLFIKEVISTDQIKSERANHYKTIYVSVRNGIPHATTISGLMSGCHYYLYIGGISCANTIEKFAKFQTLPLKVLSKDQSIRMICTHNGRLDNIVPGECSLWKDIENKIEYENVHMFVHSGNLLSVKSLLKATVLELYDILVREDCSSDVLVEYLTKMEISLKNLYIKVFNSDELRLITKRCSCVFIPGDEESAKNLSIMFIAPSTSERQDDLDPSGSVDDTESAVNSKLNKPSVEMSAGSGLLSEQISKKRGDMKKTIKSRSSGQQELRLMLIAAVMRLVRRVNWSYMRQLWDEDYEHLLREDEEKEDILRMILLVTKKIHVKKLLQASVDTAKAKLFAEFGSDAKSSDNIKESSTFLTEEIISLEKEQRDLSVQFSDLNLTIRNRPNGICLRLGTSCLLIAETVWGLLGKDGNVKLPFTVDVDIHEQIMNKLESLLSSVDGKAITDVETVAIEKEQLNRNDISLQTTDKSISSIITSVICLLTSPMLPIDESYSDSVVNVQKNYKSSQMSNDTFQFKVSHIDAKRLLHMLAKWQQESNDRSVLFTGTGPSFSASGFFIPYALDYLGNEIVTEEQSNHPKNITLDIWNKDRSKLQQIQIGYLNKRGISNLVDVDLQRYSQYYRNHDELTKHEKVLFKSYYDMESLNRRRSYWDVKFQPIILPIKKDSDGTEWFPEVPAHFELKCQNDLGQDFTLLLGPIIGALSTKSVTVILESAVSVHIELMCIDKITGAEYLCNRFCIARKPCVFQFEDLIPNHSYDISLANHPHHFLSGNFTTHRDIFIKNFDISERKTIEQLRSDNNNNIEGSSVYSGTSQSLDIKKNSLLENSEVLDNETINETSPLGPFRLLVLGDLKPSILQMSTDGDNDHDTFSVLTSGNDRETLMDGIALLKGVVDLLSQSWCGIDVVLHVGNNVDFDSVIGNVLIILNKLEMQSLLSLQGSESDQFIQEVEELLRDAYRSHWTSCPTGPLFSQGSHLIVSSVMFDLLSLFNVNTLRQLYRDITPFCCNYLIKIMSKLHDEYINNLWVSDNNFITKGFPSYINHFAGGNIVSFELIPKFVFHQNNFGGVEDNLITEDQLLHLLKLLQHPFSKMSQDNNCRNTLLLISPIPLVLEDELFDNYTFLNEEQKGIKYTNTEVLIILDMIATWIEGSPQNREVIILAGGFPSACSSIIKFRRRIGEESVMDEMSFVSSNIDNKKINLTDGSSYFEIHQLSIGPALGLMEFNNNPISEINLNSSVRDYHIVHRVDTNKRSPQCAIVEIPILNSSISTSSVVSHESVRNRKKSKKSRIVMFDSIKLKNYNLQLMNTFASISNKERMKEVSDLKPLISYLTNYIQFNQISESAPSNMTRDQMLSSIRAAIDLIVTNEIKVLSTCHSLFRKHTVFGLPINGGVDVESFFQHLFHYFISNINVKSQRICKLPSTLIFRLVWTKYLSMEKETNNGSSLLSAEMENNFELFVEIIKMCLDVQLVLDYLSFSEGYLDR